MSTTMMSRSHTSSSGGRKHMISQKVVPVRHNKNVQDEYEVVGEARLYYDDPSHDNINHNNSLINDNSHHRHAMETISPITTPNRNKRNNSRMINNNYNQVFSMSHNDHPNNNDGIIFSSNYSLRRPIQGSLAHLFFGFMYEDEEVEEEELDYGKQQQQQQQQQQRNHNESIFEKDDYDMKSKWSIFSTSRTTPNYHDNTQFIQMQQKQSLQTQQQHQQQPSSLNNDYLYRRDSSMMSSLIMNDSYDDNDYHHDDQQSTIDSTSISTYNVETELLQLSPTRHKLPIEKFEPEKDETFLSTNSSQSSYCMNQDRPSIMTHNNDKNWNIKHVANKNSPNKAIFNDNGDHHKSHNDNNGMNRLYLALCLSLLLQTFASCIPVAVISHIGYDFVIKQQQLTSTTPTNWFQSKSSSIIPAMANTTITTTSFFTSRATSASVLGISIGKMIHGPMIDIVGARQTSIRHSILLGTSLLLLAIATTATTIIYACFLVEFTNSVQWPCNIVILATHSKDYNSNSQKLQQQQQQQQQQQHQSSPSYRIVSNSLDHNQLDENHKQHDHPSDTIQTNETEYQRTLYENGIFFTSIASRLGSLIGIPLCSYLLRQQQQSQLYGMNQQQEQQSNNNDNSETTSSLVEQQQMESTKFGIIISNVYYTIIYNWRMIAFFGSWISFIAASITYFYVTDSVHQINQPQNPMDSQLLNDFYQKWNSFISTFHWKDSTNNNSSSSVNRDHNTDSDGYHHDLDDENDYLDYQPHNDNRIQRHNNKRRIDDHVSSFHSLPELKSSIGSQHISRTRKNFMSLIFYSNTHLRNQRKQLFRLIYISMRIISEAMKTKIIPSLKSILSSGIFWIVAFAHTGSSMVRTSERMIGTYIYDTNRPVSTNTDNNIDEMEMINPTNASGLSVFLSLGMIVGLLIAGTVYSLTSDERRRKYMISCLYMVTIISIYVLALLAIPSVRDYIESLHTILVLQIITISIIGFGIAVQFYHIPSIVGNTPTFDKHKGLFSSYVDGIAYGLSSIVWRIVGNAIENNRIQDNDSSTSIDGSTTISTTNTTYHHHEHGGNVGWAYGWAAVALLVILSGVLMVEFMEHFFCRDNRRGYGSYETIMLA